jgi:NitT/TauT family transport system substrate-binding protein
VSALNTRGVLYVVTGKGEQVASLADLEGKTVYAPAQNPSIIFSALCKKAGVNVTVDNSFAQPADLRTAVAAGEVALAVLPEPMVTIALSNNPDLSAALDLTAEWDKVFPAGSLVQGCVVVRTAFAEEHPETLIPFLEEYGASISALTSTPDEAAEMIVAAGIFNAAPVAKKAIPNCNLCFLTGAEMQTAMGVFLSILFEASASRRPLRADDFYCSPSHTDMKKLLQS